MDKILIQTFEPGCCRFVEPVVRSAIRGHENQIEWKHYTLPQHREALEKCGVVSNETDNQKMDTPLIVMSNQAGEEIRIQTINRENIKNALAHFIQRQE